MKFVEAMGIIASLFLILRVPSAIDRDPPVSTSGDPRDDARVVRFLALGDINLGRAVGQEILRGDTLYPFKDVLDTLAGFDLVFGNLESCLSDQGGVTQDPANNLIFAGPPAGAWTLAGAGVDIVSTANNHALDYGVDGLRETIAYLKAAGVSWVGTGEPGSDICGPVVIERSGIRIAFIATTTVMNRPGNGWKQYVAAADTAPLFSAIGQIRDSVDVVIVSYHGGEEYRDRPDLETVEFTRSVLDAGADLVIGHHPHVPYGMERWGRGIAVHSLGNFVFRQPQRYWTQRSVALAAEFRKSADGTRIDAVRFLPLRAGTQPTFALDASEADTIAQRVRRLSTIEVTEYHQ